MPGAPVDVGGYMLEKSVSGKYCTESTAALRHLFSPAIRFRVFCFCSSPPWPPTPKKQTTRKLTCWHSRCLKPTTSRIYSKQIAFTYLSQYWLARDTYECRSCRHFYARSVTMKLAYTPNFSSALRNIRLCCQHRHCTSNPLHDMITDRTC
jgi:hypothetical protein